MKRFFVFVLFCFRAGNAFTQVAEAEFLEVRGTVEIREAGSSEWKKAAPGSIAGRETVIATGFKSSAVISLGSSRLNIHPLTVLTLEELAHRDAAGETTLFLRTGRIRAVVTPPAQQNIRFTVRAPLAVASVRGTAFEFDGRHLWVENGQVLLAGSNGQKVYAAGSQRSYVDENNQNRITPPFEAEAAPLRPIIPELNNTGSGVRPPETEPPGVITINTIDWL